MRKDSVYYPPAKKALKNSALFGGIEEKELEEMLEQFSSLSLPKKSVIDFSETEKFAFVIVSGRVKISKINEENGHEYIIYLLSKGDLFDIISLLEERTHEVLIETVDEVQLLKISTKNIKKWLKSNKEFSKNFIFYLGRKMSLLEDSCVNLALFDTTTRLARLILKHIDKNSAENKNEIPLRFISDLSNETISHMIGSVRKVVNRNIQQLKKEGIILSVRGKLSLKNLEKLIEKAKEDLKC